ncbi:MarR family winged helix-turn-helix transcriptional regulator [Curtobacterium sp. MCBD17_023]|uniref:MarR family winged helix-turn-helix transcriptional regulator n=1 Tax=Curtobacterium sp. MCBD17_023 TaxID=2175657 RepID=UPI000D9C18F6|nr:MarR family winged helix-turn-helix transcriptional regulator [Curtobacterium sp. MCBD17_023]PYY48099.1 MarR family transcriptional regulator [Curtobacterium sp. MCBD17_023]
MQTRSRANQGRHALELALGESINALLSATRALTERSAASFHEGLQPAGFHIARWLHAFGPAKPSIIADAVGMDRSSTSTLLGRMRALGLVDSSPDPADRRGVIVGLSSAGEERVARTLAERGDEFGARVDAWPDADVRTLTELLNRLTSTGSVSE